VLLAGRFPQRHGDPWDRVLAAQSIIEGLPVLSSDRQLAALGANVLW
jgi:PIN domain nuclease of toxin-antitoxin system